MFIRSENLFLRPAWPEDRAALLALGLPRAHDPQRGPGGLDHHLVVTMPGVAGSRLVGSAGFREERGFWEPRLWLAPAFRHLGLHDELEEALDALAAQLPAPRGVRVAPERTLIAA